MKEELIRIWQLKMAYTVTLVLSTMDLIPNKLHKRLKLYMLMQKALIINICCIVRKFLEEQ
jgi:hypothetical protein